MWTIRLVLYVVCVLSHAVSVDATPYCTPNGQMSEADINAKVLSVVNAERQSVVAGTAQNGNNASNLLPAAISMPDLVWSCTLEEETMNALTNDDCDGDYPDAPPSGRAYLFFGDYYYDTGVFNVDINDVISATLMDNENNEFTDITASEVKYSGQYGLKYYTGLIRSTTTEIACALHVCSPASGDGMYAIMCIVNGDRGSFLTHYRENLKLRKSLVISTDPFVIVDDPGQHANMCAVNEDFPQNGDVIYEFTPTTVSTTTESTTTATSTSTVTTTAEITTTTAATTTATTTTETSTTETTTTTPTTATTTPTTTIETTTTPTTTAPTTTTPTTTTTTPTTTTETTTTATTTTPTTTTPTTTTLTTTTPTTTTPTTTTLTTTTPTITTPITTTPTTTTPTTTTPTTTTPTTTTPTTTATTTAAVTTAVESMCKNNGDNGMTDELRDTFLLKHNTLRTTLAIGSAKNGNNGTMLRRANQMPTLLYCCELEKEAYERAKQCSGMDTTLYSDVENYQIYTDRLNRSLKNGAQAAVQLWWSEITTAGPIDQLQNIFYTHLGINSFGKIASDLTTGVGCAIVHCDTSINVVCRYQTTLANAVKLYNCGPSCNKCPTGSDTCVNGLCPAVDGSCPAETALPTTAPPNTICPNNDGMKDPLRNTLLDKHNALRSALATGTVANGDTGKNCRKASKMPTLTYNCELEKTAYDHASKCDQMGTTSTENLVENSYSYPDVSKTFTDAGTEAADTWWSQITVLSGGIDQLQNIFYTHLGISSFAKMASDLTTEVGCGVVKCDNSINVVCHYNTTLANALKLYTTGLTCNKCTGGADSCVNGLCPAA